MYPLKKFGILFLALVIVLSVMGFSFQTAKAATCTEYYTVHKGDSLSKIGKAYGVSWKYLAQLNGIPSPYTIHTGQVLCVSTSGGHPQPSGHIPTFSIVGVVADHTVTIQTYNFPANDKFAVLEGPYGTKGVGGIQVATWASGKGGSQTLTFPIASALKGDSRIAIRLQSTTGSGFFAYNWFWNKTAGGNGGKPGYTGIPTFSIAAVVKNNSVTIQAYNFPANYTFVVRMGQYGTKALGGFVVGQFNSGKGGSFQKTFAIPAALYGAKRIAIRADSTAGGFFAYNWFWNNTAN